ncbi:MAG TPA: FAD/NAD(P)-binding oxidoreductase, partial [Plasticicumulans sp.]
MRLTRRGFVGAAALAGFAALSRRLPAAPPARVLVVGGGYAGACCAKYLQRLDPALAVTLLTRPDPYYTCPFSNLLLAGRLGLDELEQRHDALAHAGVEVRYGEAIAVDPVAKRVQLDDGSALVADRLVLAPGVELAFDALPGYDAAAAAILPHAWEAGAQTVLLRRQLEALPDGGTVLISVPPEPYRCPPGPYERASLIAWWLRRARPRAKLLILDAKDRFSKQALFREGWQALYGQQLEWVPGSDGGRIERVEAATRTLHAGFGF